MLNNKKIVVVLPAYNAADTLTKTYQEIPMDIVDDVVLVDDASKDDTINVGHELGIKHIIKHEYNKGYGGNQKSCYSKAIELGADIIIMLHPDYQYTPKLIPSIAHIIANDLYPVVLGSRILGNGALKGGMPLYKYIANRFLTFSQNILIGQKLNITRLYRIKANLRLRSFFNRSGGGYHIDPYDCSHTSIYYINTNNGYTKFKNGAKIKSVENRMVVFSSHLEHQGYACSDKLKRVVVNFNYDK